MSEENKVVRGVIIEFDFAVMNGAELLFETAKKVFSAVGIELTVKLEAKHLAGGNYQGGIAEMLSSLEKEGDAAVLARELADSFKTALNEKVPAAVTPEFKSFVKSLTDKGIKVVVDTRADVETVKAAFDGIDGIELHQETSLTYGNLKWDAWRRACGSAKLNECLTVAVTGSGFGVKGAIVGGLSAVAVCNDRVAYQDFGGADEVASSLDGSLEAAICRILRLD